MLVDEGALPVYVWSAAGCVSVSVFRLHHRISLARDGKKKYLPADSEFQIRDEVG